MSDPATAACTRLQREGRRGRGGTDGASGGGRRSMHRRSVQEEVELMEEADPLKTKARPPTKEPGFSGKNPTWKCTR